MIPLDYAGTRALSLITAQNGADVAVAFSDFDTTSEDYARGVPTLTTISSATTTAICATPASGKIRDVEFVNIKNTYAGAHAMTLQITSGSGGPFVIATFTLQSGDSFRYTHGSGIQVLDSNGSVKFTLGNVTGNLTVGGTLTVTGATTLSSALTYGGVTLSNAVTGTGNMVLSASPTFTGTINSAAIAATGALSAASFAGDTTSTPTYIGSTSDPTVTYGTGTGCQIKKLGKLVIVSGYISTNSATGGSGEVRIALSGITTPVQTCAVSISGSNWGVNNPSAALILAGETVIRIYYRATSAATTSAITVSDLSNSSGGFNEVYFSVAYTVA